MKYFALFVFCLIAFEATIMAVDSDLINSAKQFINANGNSPSNIAGSPADNSPTPSAASAVPSFVPSAVASAVAASTSPADDPSSNSTENNTHSGAATSTNAGSVVYTGLVVGGGMLLSSWIFILI